MTACALCHRTADDGHRLCPLHADEIRAWLAELPHQAELLAEFLAPAAGAREGRTSSGRAHSPIPVDLRVLVLLGPGHPGPVGAPQDDTDDTVPITTFLAGWAGHIAYAYPAVHRDPHGTAHVEPCDQAWPAGGRTAAAWCTWLLAYLPYALTLPAVADLHRQLDRLLARVRDLTHTTPRRHPKDAPCPACQAFRLAAVDGQEHIACTACGHRLTPDQYDQHATALLHSLDKDQQPA